MSSEKNKTIVRRLLEEPWKGDLRVVDELIDSKYVGYNPSFPEPLRGPELVRDRLHPFDELLQPRPRRHRHAAVEVEQLAGEAVSRRTPEVLLEQPPRP